MSYTGEKIQAPETVLSTVERQWRTQVADGSATLHKEARCYFSGPEEAKDVDALAYCGPLRHYIDPNPSATDANSRPGDGIWDTYVLKTKSTGDGLTFTEPRIKSRGTNLPAGIRIFRIDEKEPPKGGADLVPPPPPAARPGLIATPDEVEIKGAKKPSDGYVVTPIEQISVDQAGTVSQVVTDEGTRSPAKGEQFRVLVLSFSPGPFADDYEGTYNDSDLVDPTVSYSVKVGSDRQPLDWGLGHRPKNLVVSAHTGVEPELVATVLGKDQSLSVTSGSRTSEVATAFYASSSEAVLNRAYPKDTYQQGDFRFSYSALFTSATLSPFDPKRGWAPDGKSWLSLGMDQETGTGNVSYDVRFDNKNSIGVTDQNGNKSTDVRTSDSHSLLYNAAIGSPLIEVDSTSLKYTVRFQPTFHFALTPPAIVFTPVSGSGSTKPLTFTVEFSR
ncbi:hypothetical protein [Actinopolymorpha pittospori]|uniref:Uncharacterized protein n=1 Tax=Actinopolymorpha pittospori TaxID=648752 RepID=A0A927MR27_9ACTN|nr:hypothetical protein [Actinopolymorpha pittospori]MBE1605109.1 hypothetical protein [Actinopolymorpha pittospori]